MRRFPKGYYESQKQMCSDAQWSYIQRLLDEAFVHHCPTGLNLDRHHLPTFYTKAQASADIRSLLSLKSSGWQHSK